MRYFDTHAHIFPDKVAAKVVATLENYYHMKWSGDGSVGDLTASMERNHVERAVILSCATKPEQVCAINDYLHSVQRSDPQRFCAIGTLHPDYPKVLQELERFPALGLRGVKLHPDFQHIYIDEPKMFPVYEAIENSGLPILIHVGDERTDFSSPWRLARVLDRFPDLKVIAAHLGGYSDWDGAWKHLVGRNLWFDTSSALWRLPVDEARRLAHAHGADKLLFGSDYPAVHHEQAIADVLALEFSEAENELIFYRNAEKLFGSEKE